MCLGLLLCVVCPTLVVVDLQSISLLSLELSLLLSIQLFLDLGQSLRQLSLPGLPFIHSQRVVVDCLSHFILLVVEFSPPLLLQHSLLLCLGHNPLVDLFCLPESGFQVIQGAPSCFFILPPLL